jgi:hypothetical protein
MTWSSISASTFSWSTASLSADLTRDKFTVNTRELPWMACETVEIEFAVDDAMYARLKELLRQVMVGCPSDFDIRD